jgi:hypothetical protein
LSTGTAICELKTPADGGNELVRMLNSQAVDSLIDDNPWLVRLV